METAKTGRIYSVCIGIVMCVFAVCSLALISVGALEYKNIAFSNAENFDLRTSLSYVATKVRQHDSEGAIEIREIDGTPILSLSEDIDGVLYETAIYHKNGKLCEYYHEKGKAFNLLNGFEVMSISDFSFELDNDGILRLQAVNFEDESEHMILCIDSLAR